MPAGGSAQHAERTKIHPSLSALVMYLSLRAGVARARNYSITSALWHLHACDASYFLEVDVCYCWCDCAAYSMSYG